jgi:hypothetical protein
LAGSDCGKENGRLAVRREGSLPPARRPVGAPAGEHRGVRKEAEGWPQNRGKLLIVVPKEDKKAIRIIFALLVFD